MRLIDADALLREVGELKKSSWFNNNYDWARFVCKEAMEIIEDICIEAVPTVDAVEVVRCGECKHYKDIFCGLHVQPYCDREVREMREPSDFCSYGEKK